MSQLRVTGTGQSDFYLNVLSFDAPVVGEMNSGQCRSAIQYYPIKAYQPELRCEVIFPSEAIWQAWQAWVRQNMINAQTAGVSNGTCTLNWPQRNINNWTAIICAAKAGGMRANFTPRTTVEFQLIVSLVSTVGTFAAVANAVSSLTSGAVGGGASGGGGGGGGGSASGAGSGSLDGVLVQPIFTGGASSGAGGVSGLLNATAGSPGTGGATGLTSLTSSLGGLTGSLGSLTGVLGSVESLIPGLSSITGILGGL